MKRSLWIAAITSAALVATAPSDAFAQYHSYPGMSLGISPFSASWHSLYGPGYYGSHYGYYGGRNYGSSTYKSRDYYDRYERPRGPYRYDDYGHYDRNNRYYRDRDSNRVYFQ